MNSYQKNTKETGKNVVKHISSIFTKNKKHCREKKIWKKQHHHLLQKAPAPPSPNLSKNHNWDPSKTQLRLVRKRKEQMGFWWRWKCFTKRRRRQQKCCFVEERREEKRSFQQNQKEQEKQKWVGLSSFSFKKVEGKRNPIPTQHPSPLQPTKSYKQQPRPLHHHSRTLLHKKEGRFFHFLSFLFPNSLFFSLPKNNKQIIFSSQKKEYKFIISFQKEANFSHFA